MSVLSIIRAEIIRIVLYFGMDKMTFLSLDDISTQAKCHLPKLNRRITKIHEINMDYYNGKRYQNYKCVDNILIKNSC